MPQSVSGGQRITLGVGPHLSFYLRQGLLLSAACAKLAGPGVSRDFPVSTSHLAMHTDYRHMLSQQDIFT